MRVRSFYATKSTHLENKSLQFPLWGAECPMNERWGQSGVICVLFTLSAPPLTFPEINLLEAGNGVWRSFHGGWNCQERYLFLWAWECLFSQGTHHGHADPPLSHTGPSYLPSCMPPKQHIMEYSSRYGTRPELVRPRSGTKEIIVGRGWETESHWRNWGLAKREPSP